MFWLIVVRGFCACSVPWFKCFSVPIVAFVNYFPAIFTELYISPVFFSPSVECSASFANVAPWAICRYSIHPGRSVTPVRDHIRLCQQNLVNYLNNIARSSKILLKIPKEFYNFRKWKYFQIHGPSFQYRIYHQRTNMTGLYYSLFCLKIHSHVHAN